MDLNISFQGSIVPSTIQNQYVSAQYFTSNENKLQKITKHNYDFLEIRNDDNWGRGVFFDMKNISQLPPQCQKDRSGAIYLRQNTIIEYYGGIIRHVNDWRNEKRMALEKYPDAIDITTKYEYAYKYKDHDYVIDAANYPATGKDIGHLLNHSSEAHINCKFKSILINTESNEIKQIIAVKTISQIPLGHQLLTYYSEKYDLIFHPINNTNSTSLYQIDNLNDGDDDKDADY